MTGSAPVPARHDLLGLRGLFDLIDLALEHERALDDEHEDDGGADLRKEHGGARGEDGEEGDGLHDELDDDRDGDEADDEVNDGVHDDAVVEWWWRSRRRHRIPCRTRGEVMKISVFTWLRGRAEGS